MDTFHHFLPFFHIANDALMMPRKSHKVKEANEMSPTEDFP
jgi:hypothetical protein